MTQSVNESDGPAIIVLNTYTRASILDLVDRNSSIGSGDVTPGVFVNGRSIGYQSNM